MEDNVLPSAVDHYHQFIHHPLLAEDFRDRLLLQIISKHDRPAVADLGWCLGCPGTTVSPAKLQTSGERVDNSHVSALKLSDLHPPYDFGEVQKFVRQLSDQER